MGDRAIGKTSMLVALADTSAAQIVKMVKPEPEVFRKTRTDPQTGRAAPTDRNIEELVVLSVDLPAATYSLPFRCLDTPGETWENPNYQITAPDKWREMIDIASNTIYALVFMPPPRTMVKQELVVSDPSHKNYLNIDTLPNREQWLTQFDSKLGFLSENCTNLKYILLCLHKADACCDVNQVGSEWSYDPRTGNNWNWTHYNDFVQLNYLRYTSKILRQYTRGTPQVRTFLTSTNNRSMLELPWIYLATQMA